MIPGESRPTPCRQMQGLRGGERFPTIVRERFVIPPNANRIGLSQPVRR